MKYGLLASQKSIDTNEAILQSVGMNTTFQIIEKLGGQDKVLELVNENCGLRLEKGRPVPDTASYRAIRNWHSEGKIPPGRKLLLMEIAEKIGVDCSMADFEPRYEEELA